MMSPLVWQFLYSLKRWAAFALFLHDGRVCRFYAAAEPRGIAIGRGSWTFASGTPEGRGRRLRLRIK
jgi:transposase